MSRSKACWFLPLSLLLIVCPKSDANASDELEFSIEVMSILSKAGCNAGTCHGNLNGKGGFKLSLRGQDAAFDYRSLVQASRGRRINCSAPEESLFLKKATGQVSHRGGIRFASDSEEYRQLVAWIRAGARAPSGQARSLKELTVHPSSAVIDAPDSSLQIRVTAHFSDGTQRDVTRRACYELSNLKSKVDPDGLVTRQQLGETTLIVRYLNQQVPVNIAFIDSQPDFQWRNPEENNFIDTYVHSKLHRLSIQPSPICGDSVFIRRAYLDAVGRLPTAEEARSFVCSQQPDKRLRLVDDLLANPGFADYWALKFADILRVEEKVLDPKGVEIFHAWIRENMQAALPLDEFARKLITGTGSTFDEPAANFYRANRDPPTRGETTARLFLGTRLQCAKCHNHPFDRWTQDDYYQWANLFSQIDYDLGENKRKDKLDKNEFAGEQIVLVAKQREVHNPTSGEIAKPKLLGGPEVEATDALARLESTADWLTSPRNELFVKSQVNFIWYHLMGQGLVDPIDDFRLTNPASNPPLLNALAEHFVACDFDLRKIVKTIMLSRTYQASSQPLPSNQHDESSYSHAVIRRYPAEVLLDMQSDFLGNPAEFVGYPIGIRALQIPGVQRVRPREQPPKAGDRFLTTFGKPPRIMACDCERSNETNLKQVLGLLGAGLNGRLESSPRLRSLAESSLSDSEVIDQLYWSGLSRAPTEDEVVAATRLLVSPEIGRSLAIQDIAWAILNAKEFLFRR